MPTGSLLALLDDVTSVLDDVSAMTKVAAHKTAGVLGDDLALNAQQVSGVKAERELPVVFAVARGSLVNKAILVPSALAISAFVPFLVTPLLMIGGVYLCFEGAEKIAHKLFHDNHRDADASAKTAVSNNDEDDKAAHELSAHAEREADLSQTDHSALEKEKIRGAIRTDFILSAEIVTIALGTVADEPFMTRLFVLTGIGLLMTVGVYGLVACIVKLDDVGFFLARSKSGLARNLGLGLVHFTPYLMRALTVVGTAAMFLVGGGIVAHGVAPIHSTTEHIAQWVAAAVPSVAAALAAIVEALINATVGLASGALALVVVSAFVKARSKFARRGPST